MLKDYLKEHNVSIYALAKSSGVPYSTLNDLCNGKVVIENCKAGIVKKLADSLEITMDALYELAEPDKRIVHVAEYNKDAEIKVRNKRYKASFEYNGEQIELDLCKVSEPTTFYADDIATWRTEEYLSEKFLEEYDGISTEEKR